MNVAIDIIIDQADSAILSRDYNYAEKILFSALKKPNIKPEDIITCKQILGKLYMKSEQFEKCLKVYKELNQLSQNDVNILNNIGVVYRRLNRLDESIEVLKQAKLLDDKNETTLYNLGNTYKQKGNYGNAALCFSEVLESKPDDVLAYNHLGVIYFLCKDYEKAIDSYKQGLRIDPNHPFLNFNLAEVYKAQKKYGDAIASYNAALNANPNWNEALTAQAVCYEKSGKLNIALQIYKKIVGLHKVHEKDFTKLAQLYESDDKISDAEFYYKKALEKNKGFLPAVLNYSKLLKKQNRYFDAYTVLSNGTKTNENNKDLLIEIADVCLMLEDYRKAKSAVSNLNLKWKNDFQVLKMNGKLFSVLGYNKKAEYIFEYLLNAAPNEIGLRIELADLYLHTDKFNKAAEQLIKFLKDCPQDISARLKLGSAYEQLGKFDAAKNEYNKIIKNDAKNIAAIEAIANLNKRQGNAEEALQLAGKLVDMQTSSECDDDLKGLSNSLQMYEDVIDDYGNNAALNKNLEKLSSASEGFDLTPDIVYSEEIVNENFDEDDELILNESYEDIPDDEQPFDDLFELTEDDFDKKNNDELDDIVSFDSPIDESIDAKEVYGNEHSALDGAGKLKKSAIPQEEIQLADTSDSGLPKKQKEAPVSFPVSFEETDEDITPKNSKNKSVQEHTGENKSDGRRNAISDDSAGAPYRNAELKSANTQDKDNEFSKTVNSLTDIANQLIRKIDQLEYENTKGLFEIASRFAHHNDTEQYTQRIENAINGLADKLSKKDLQDTNGITDSENIQKTLNPYRNLFSHKVKEEPEFNEELKKIQSTEMIKLFSYLGDIMGDLPDKDLKQFLLSNERIQMEYIIDKLSGEVGLKKRMVLINLKDMLNKTLNSQSIDGKFIKDVLNYLRSIAVMLPDKSFAESFISKINDLIRKIEYV